MQTTKKTRRENRTKFHGQLEVLDEASGLIFDGTTTNLSDRGIGARLNGILPSGTVVQIKYAAEDDDSIVEMPGKIVWSAGEIYDSNSEVGIEIDMDTCEEEEKNEGGAVPFLEPGQDVWLFAGSKEYPALVEEVKDSNSNGVTRVTVVLGANAREADELTGNIKDVDIEDDSMDTDAWTPHPIRDLVGAIKKYGAPVFAAIGFLASALYSLFLFLYEKIPQSFKCRVKKHAAPIWNRFKIDRLLYLAARYFRITMDSFFRFVNNH